MTTAEKRKRRYWLAGNREPGQDEFFVAALDPSLWEPGSQDDWDSCWYTGMPDPDVFEKLDVHKTINHIPGNNGITIKDNLHNTLLAARQRLASAADQARMDYFPRVYAMPGDYHALQQTAFANPQAKWILKPKNSSRGRGIEVLGDIADVPLDDQWMVQEYIGRPHLMNARKYVLRLYVLITSVEPLRVYLHREGFAKLASEPYNIQAPDNPYAHLTNPDVNATNTDADAPVVFVSIGEYRQWLRDQGADDDALFAKIRDLVTLTAIAVREHMRQRTGKVGAPVRGCYELLGVDCLVDAQLKPWILECNLSPSLEVCAGPEDGGDTERQIKRSMVADMVSLLGLNAPPAVREGLPPEEVIRRDGEDELARAGGFERLFPAAETAEDYLRFFPVPRLADVTSVRQVTGKAPPPVRLAPNQTTEIVSQDELALYSERTGTLFTPTPLASWIWLKAVDGAQPEEIAAELIASHTQAHGAPDAAQQWMIRENVWDALSNWAQLGLLRRAGEEAAPAPERASTGMADTASRQQVSLCETAITLTSFCPVVAAHMQTLYGPLARKDGASSLEIAIHQAAIGYAVTAGPHLVAAGLGLDTVAQLVSRALFEQAARTAAHIAVAGTLVPLNGEEAVLFVAPAQDKWEDALALSFAAKAGKGFAGGARLDLQTPRAARAIGLPVRLDAADRKMVETQLQAPLDGTRQTWPNGRKGVLTPSRMAGLERPYSLRAIIVPERSGGSAQIGESASHKTLAALLVSASGHRRTALEGAQVSNLNDWLGACALHAIRYGDPEEAAASLAQALAL